MKALFAIMFGISLAALSHAQPASWGAPVGPRPESELFAQSVPIADVHMHFDRREQSANQMLQRMKDNGVRWGGGVGCSSYHDILPAVKRLEIGYTWYAKSTQRTHVNTACKLLLMTHAFETLGCHVVGWRTDNFNFASQAAIERLGARKDGVIRGHALRRDGTIRDTVMYSLRSGEWPEVKAQLLYSLHKPR